MCRRVTCEVCGKATWEGCGQHVEEALRGIPQEQRCAGHDHAAVGVVSGGGSAFRPASPASPAPGAAVRGTGAKR